VEWSPWVLLELMVNPSHTVFVSLTSDTSVRIDDGDEEVWSGLSVGWLVSHVDEGK